MDIDGGKLGCPSRRTQGNRDDIGQLPRKFALAIVGIAGLERIVVLVTHGLALMHSCVTPRLVTTPSSYASQRLRRR